MEVVHLQDFTYAIDNVVLWTNIEANCVLIGACIPTLFPLARKLFGASIMGGSTGPSKPRQTGEANEATGGSYAKKKRSQFDTAADIDDSKYIILEERSFQFNIADRRSDDGLTMKKGRGIKEYEW